jgi:chromosome segregation ATPase
MNEEFTRDDLIEKLKADLKRVKLQRNEYELEIRTLYRRITALEAEKKDWNTRHQQPSMRWVKEQIAIRRKEIETDEYIHPANQAAILRELARFEKWLYDPTTDGK